MSIAEQILLTPEYQSGLRFSARDVYNRLRCDYHQAKAGCAQLVDQRKLTKSLKGTVTMYTKPQTHWIHTGRLAGENVVQAPGGDA